MTRSPRLAHESTFDGPAMNLKEQAGKVVGMPQRFKDLIQMKTRYPLFMTENLKKFTRNVSHRPFQEVKSDSKNQHIKDIILFHEHFYIQVRV